MRANSTLLTPDFCCLLPTADDGRRKKWFEESSTERAGTKNKVQGKGDKSKRRKGGVEKTERKRGRGVRGGEEDKSVEEQKRQGRKEPKREGDEREGGKEGRRDTKEGNDKIWKRTRERGREKG